MSARRILLVDDQRETSRMLRMMLEYLNQGYVIVEVPSGEEAMLEVWRGPFDLLITDVRLPGISGLELTARIRKTNPEARVIVISGLTDPELREAAEELEADAFFAKPIDSDRFVETVQAMLGQAAPAEAAPEGAAAPAEAAPAPEDTEVSERLALLRRDLGALAVFLADADGRVVMSAGDVARLDVGGLLGHLLVAFSAARRVSALLGDGPGAHVQYFGGRDYDLYSLNAGQEFVLVAAYEGERGARAMGPVLSYGRPCAEGLARALARRAEALPPEPFAPPDLPPEALPEREAAAPASDPRLEELLRAAPAGDADAFWEAAVSEAPEESDRNALTYEQARTLGLLPKEDAL